MNSPIWSGVRGESGGGGGGWWWNRGKSIAKAKR